MDKNNLHDGHRLRLKKKFVTKGISALEEHEILELLLFYSIPRKNTNEIAHELINKFGNIKNVLNADINILTEVDGLGENSAILLKLIPNIINVYTNSNQDDVSLKTLDDIKQFCINQYIGVECEVLKAIYLTNNCKYIACEDICTINSASEIPLNIRKIIERAEKYKSKNVILTHNHPKASTKPSNDDLVSTDKVIKIFKDLSMILIDHIIVSGNDTLSMKYTGYI